MTHHRPAAARHALESFVEEVRRSPLYHAIASGVTGDDDVVDLLAHAPHRQMRATLLFAAVHHLLLSGVDHPLARWYPSVTAEPSPPGDPTPDFAAFCRDHRDEVLALVSTRSTQTNEVGRTGVLRAALANIGGPVQLIEVGASAGLNLMVERFRHEYERPGAVEVVGAVDSPVVVRTDCTRGTPPPVGPTQITDAIGVDLHPIDLSDPDAALWLEACVWADDLERLARLRAAIGLAHPAPRVLEADLLDAVPGLVEGASSHPVVWHSWVAAYLTAAEQGAFAEMMDRLGAQRPLDWIFLEWPPAVANLAIPGVDGDDNLLVRVAYRDGRRCVSVLATCHPHGRWMSWQ